MNMLDRALAQLAPGVALARAKNRVALALITAHYDAATPGKRGSSWRPVATDANGAGTRRDVLARVARDMVRNTAFAPRIRQVVSNNIVGDGIIPKVKCNQKRRAAQLREAVIAHFDTTLIDADGKLNLYGLQRLAAETIVESGEVLIRRRRRDVADGLPIPFQIQVLEPDFICTTMDGPTSSGTVVRDGIEFDAIGKRVAYLLYAEHPGASGMWLRASTQAVRRVPASEILHIYRVDRPGQMRGVSWYAPVALRLQDYADYIDAQIVRQKIAAVFAAFRTSPETETETGAVGTGRYDSLSPGRIENLLPGESIVFADPPGVDGLDETTRSILRGVAADIGVTYESLTGDLSNVNFTSGRMGRMEMDRNVSSWQWLMMIPQMMQPIGQWALEAFQIVNGEMPEGTTLDWVPPHRMLVDPTREIPALANKVRAGFASRSGVVRELGFDPEQLLEEQIQDAADADRAKLIFDTDPRHTSGAGQAQTTTPGDLPGKATGVANGEQ